MIRTPRSAVGIRFALLALPLAFLFFTFLLPLGTLLHLSFQNVNPSQGGVVPPGYSLANYERFLLDPYYLAILWRTVKVSLITTAVCVVVGYPVAYALNVARPRTASLILLVFLAPLLISAVVRSFAWVVLLAPNGVINVWLGRLGLTEEPLRLMWNEFGIVVGLVHVFLSLMILTIYTRLTQIDARLLLAARNLGASGFDAFRKITLPLSLPGVIAGVVLVFSISASTFITPALLGGTRAKVVAYLIYEQNLVLLNWSFGAAISFIMLLVTLGITFAVSAGFQGRRWRGIR
ncbi:MAG: ABC transporter permease [Burkholderiales bacterium]|nr:ABC transporter permease [Burkholderiales bacterium]